MAVRATTSTVVRVNAKIESFNLLRAPSFTDGTLISEGEVFYLDSAGNPVKLSSSAGGSPTGIGLPAFINWVTSSRSDVQDAQSFPMGDTDAASIALDSGGLAGIIGNGTMIGLPKSMFAASQTFTQGWYVIPSATAGKFGTADATPDVSVGITTGQTATFGYRWVYGKIVRVEGDIVWFLFNSTPVLTPVSITAA